MASPNCSTLRLDPDVIEALKAQGPGWQTRINNVVRADIEAGRIVKASD